uniref:Portal protein n=1 Tax=viral metagenome TaxID=1070528 RepID=A0A6H1ZG66_9ZZZZ
MADDVQFEETKQDDDYYTGGCPVKLDKKVKGVTVLDGLKSYIQQQLEDAEKGQAGLIKKITDWNLKYKGVKPKKVYPYEGAANLSIPMTRWLTDTVVVRVLDVIFSTKKVWTVEAKKEEFIGIDRQLEDALDWWQRSIVKFRRKIYPALLQCIKIGKGVIKIEFVRKKKTITRYASEEEKQDSSIKKYVTADGRKVVKVPKIVYEGCDIFPIDRQDFIISADSDTIEKADIVGFRFPSTLEEIKYKVKKKLYLKEADAIGAEKQPDEKADKAESEHKDITPQSYEKPWLTELWLKYDVDGDGEPDDIVVTYHKETGTICRCIYNPMFYGFRPFKDFTFYPIEYSFDGDGTCAILEHLQEEIDSLHNQRIDRMNQINSLQVVIGPGMEEDQDFKMYPGKQWKAMDLETAMKEIRWSDVLPSSFNEEGLLNSYAEKSVGVTPGVMGIPSSDRPVFRDTAINLQEANKKFKLGIENIFRDMEEIGMTVIEMFAQYQPIWTYMEPQKGKYVEKKVEFPFEFLRDGFNVKLSAASDEINTDTRLERNITTYQMLSDFYTKQAGIIGAIANPEVPPLLKLYMFQTLGKGTMLMRRILEDAGCVDAETLVEDPTNPKQVGNEQQTFT